jgi:hypothetical protein
MRAGRPLFRRSGNPRFATTKGVVIRTEGLTTDRDGLVSRRGVETGVLTVVRSVIGILRSVAELASFGRPSFGLRF